MTNKLPKKVEDFLRELLRNNWKDVFVNSSQLYIEDTEHRVMIKYWLSELQSRYDELIGAKNKPEARG